MPSVAAINSLASTGGDLGRTVDTTALNFSVHPSEGLNGEIRVPGDKSISHRAIMLGALAEGTTEVSGFLQGEDSLHTLKCFQNMGVRIEGPNDGQVRIEGVGLRGLSEPVGSLYVGNSGTAMRLMAGILSGQAFDTVLTGDESLSGRPMRRITQPLKEMGADIDTAANGTPPLKIGGGAKIKAYHYDLPMASAQVKSAVLLAGLYGDGITSVTEPGVTRDHTERMLQAMGVTVTQDAGKISMVPGQPQGISIDVPADISSAAFFLVAASITPNSDLTLRHVGMNPTRVGVVEILHLMGADIQILNERMVGAEPVADLRVRTAQLKGIEIPEPLVPLAIDEFPVLFVAASCAQGPTLLRGAEELRVKESDRIQAMAEGLQALGVDAQPLADGMLINPGKIQGGTVESHTDHRIAMAFSIAGNVSEGPITIKDCVNVNTSFPGFLSLAQQVGMHIEEQR